MKENKKGQHKDFCVHDCLTPKSFSSAAQQIHKSLKDFLIKSHASTHNVSTFSGEHIVYFSL